MYSKACKYNYIVHVQSCVSISILLSIFPINVRRNTLIEIGEEELNDHIQIEHSGERKQGYKMSRFRVAAP